jgi:hypothetical protein
LAHTRLSQTLMVHTWTNTRSCVWIWNGLIWTSRLITWIEMAKYVFEKNTFSIGIYLPIIGNLSDSFYTPKFFSNEVLSFVSCLISYIMNNNNDNNNKYCNPLLFSLLRWDFPFLKSSVLWDITLCSPLKVPETSVDFQRTTRRYIPEDRTLHNQLCESLKSSERFQFLIVTMRSWSLKTLRVANMSLLCFR